VTSSIPQKGDENSRTDVLYADYGCYKPPLVTPIVCIKKGDVVAAERVK
jgi:hypothetical protein